MVWDTVPVDLSGSRRTDYVINVVMIRGHS